jgi:hypothetical protein
MVELIVNDKLETDWKESALTECELKNMNNSLTRKHPDALTLIQHATVNLFLNILLLSGQFFQVRHFSVPVEGNGSQTQSLTVNTLTNATVNAFEMQFQLYNNVDWKSPPQTLRRMSTLTTVRTLRTAVIAGNRVRWSAILKLIWLLTHTQLLGCKRILNLLVYDYTILHLARLISADYLHCLLSVILINVWYEPQISNKPTITVRTAPLQWFLVVPCLSVGFQCGLAPVCFNGGSWSC